MNEWKRYFRKQLAVYPRVPHVCTSTFGKMLLSLLNLNIYIYISISYISPSALWDSFIYLFIYLLTLKLKLVFAPSLFHPSPSQRPLFGRLQTTRSPPERCVSHLLPHSLTSGPAHSFHLSHTHQWLRHASPASLLPLQLHFICCRSSRVAPLNDSVRPVVGVWLLLIMPVSLWGALYRQMRPEESRAAASHHLSWWRPVGPDRLTANFYAHQWPRGSTSLKNNCFFFFSFAFS